MNEMNNGKACADCGSANCAGCGSMGCKCPHHKVPMIAVALIGLSFLLTNLGVMTASMNGIVWPILLIIASLSKVSGKMCKCDTKK